MKPEQVVLSLWRKIDCKNWSGIEQYFARDAVVNWYNTNERFAAGEFVDVNREYPGDWTVGVEKIMSFENTVISVVRVSMKSTGEAFHAISFFRFGGGLIEQLDEYWGEGGPPPQWRTDKGIGSPIY